MQIFSHTGTLTDKDSKTNIRFDLSVPEGAKRLIVQYSYSPKTVADEQKAGQLVVDGLKKYDLQVVNASAFLPVMNFATLSFDECGEYRGACHRHPNEQTIVIADKDSTPGVFNRPIKAGNWDIVVNAHYIGCNVDYSISVEVEL